MVPARDYKPRDKANVEALKLQERDAASRELSFLERLGLLVDQQWNWLENQALGRRLKGAKLRTNACVEEIDYPRPARSQCPSHCVVIPCARIGRR